MVSVPSGAERPTWKAGTSPKSTPGDARDDQHGHEHAAVDRELFESRHGERLEPADDSDEEGRDDDAAESAQRRDEQALHHELPREPDAAGAQRDPHRELPRAGGRARDEEAADVGARDEQHEGHGDRQDERHRPHVVHHARLQRLDEHAALRVGVRILAREPPCNRFQLRLGARDRHVIFQTGDDVEVVRSAAGAGARIEPERNPRVGFQMKAETFRQDADDEIRLAVEVQPLAQDVRVRPERRPPEPMGQYRHVRDRPIFFEREAPAERRRNPEDVEELP